MAIQRLSLATVLITATAFWTPWWGTILVTLAIAILSGFSTGILSIASFSGWLLAILFRDFSNEHGPSRTLVRMFSLTDVFYPLEQPAVILSVAFIGACLGGSTAGLVNAIKDWRENRKKQPS